MFIMTDWDQAWGRVDRSELHRYENHRRERAAEFFIGYVHALKAIVVSTRRRGQRLTAWKASHHSLHRKDNA